MKSATREPWRGSTIVLALLVTALAAVIALGFLSRRVGQRAVVNSAVLHSQAKALAWAGLEDARVKLLKSRDFPPGASLGVETFSYSEQLSNSTGVLVGSYLVDVDLSHVNRVVIRCSATLADETYPRLALRGELDVEPERGSFGVAGSPTVEQRPFRWIRVEVVDVRSPE